MIIPNDLLSFSTWTLLHVKEKYDRLIGGRFCLKKNITRHRAQTVVSWSNPLFPSRSSVLIYMYMYIYIYALLYEFSFLWFTNCVLLFDVDSLIPGCLWLLAFVLNNILILGICCSTIPHLPGCFCPWSFFQNIGFNMVPPLCHI